MTFSLENAPAHHPDQRIAQRLGLRKEAHLCQVGILRDSGVERSVSTPGGGKCSVCRDDKQEAGRVVCDARCQLSSVEGWLRLRPSESQDQKAVLQLLVLSCPPKLPRRRLPPGADLKMGKVTRYV